MRGVFTLLRFLVFFTVPGTTTLAGQAPAFVGTWRLVSFHARDSAGAISYTLGEHAEGRLMYDAAGNMSVQMMSSGRSHFSAADVRGGTVEEKSRALDGYSAYYGRYTVDTALRAITHHIDGALFPNWTSTILVRTYRFEDERLTLTTAPMTVGGRRVRSELVWERMR